MRRITLFICLVLLFGQLIAQNRTISGTVVDEKGLPVPLASVSVKGEKTGVTTGADGSFKIRIGPNAKKLVFSSIGFQAQEITISASDNITIALKISQSDIGEVIVTGYGKIKRSEYSGAASVVVKEQVNDIPMASFDQILQGRVPGLLVTVGSGQPGSAARVQIRGMSSISGGSDPLYIVDGMPVEAENFRSLNPADFETVDVLKDAVATAQYGNRGSSGVIVVTTKRGKPGRSVLSYTGQGGITQPGKEHFDMANSTQLLKIQEMIGQQLSGVGLPGWVYSPLNPANTGSSAAQAAAAASLDSLRNINTDWKSIFEHKGTFAQHDLSFAGGTGNTQFYLAGGYYSETGIGLHSNLKRYTFRANVDHKTDKLTLSLSSGFGYTSSDYIVAEHDINLTNEFAAVYLALPYQKLFNPDGSVNTGSGHVGPNAYDLLVNGSKVSDGQIKANLGLNANYDITRNIYAGGYFGLDYRQTTNTNAIYPNTYYTNHIASFPIGPDLTVGDTIGNGSYNIGTDDYFEYVARGILGFKKIFAGVHDVDIQAMTEFTKDHQYGFGLTGYGIDPNLLNTPAGITQGTTLNKYIANTTGYMQERALFAAMLIGRYTYMGKYTFNGTFRRDATTQLAPNKRYQNFYSAGVTWNVLKESFAEDWNKIDRLNFRVSYGQAANADGFYFGYFGYLPTYGAGTYAGQPITAPTNAGNPDVVWERIKTWNAGADFGFFKSRITGSLDIYRKETDGNIITQQLSYTSGYVNQPVNAGVVVNKGIELGLNVDVVRIKNFRWAIGGNVSYNNNKVTNLNQVSEFEQGTELVKVGLPLGSHYIVKWAGVDAATGQPLYYDKAGKITNVYSADNNVSEFGTYNAPWIGGFNTGVYYKEFSLEAFFTFQEKFSVFNNQDYFQTNAAFALQGFNVRNNMLTMWTKPGDVTNIQSPLYQRQFSSKDIQDASYVRFRNLTLAYNFNKRVLSKTKVLSAARLFVQAQNLYTWTKWIGFDPEYDNNIATYNYPVPRTYTVGLTVSF